MDHLEELRLRLFYMLGFWAAGAALAWTYRGPLLELLKHPIRFAKGEVNLVAIQLTDQLFVSLSVALWGGLIVALPFMLHQVWLFVMPGLTATERRWAVPFILGAGLSFGLGTVFCYQIILPYAVPFLVDFLDGAVIVNLNIAQYISQILTYLAVFGLIFELPILAFLLTKIGLVNARMLGSVRRFAFVIILIVSAIITPTSDPVNLMLMAGPLYLLYEVGIIVSRFAAPRPVAVEQEELEV